MAFKASPACLHLLFFLLLGAGQLVAQVGVPSGAPQALPAFPAVKSPPPGFPEIPGEGASPQQWKRYHELKDLWIKQNPEAYRLWAESPSLYSRPEEDSIRARKEEEMRVKETLPTKK